MLNTIPPIRARVKNVSRGNEWPQGGVIHWAIAHSLSDNHLTLQYQRGNAKMHAISRQKLQRLTSQNFVAVAGL